jgi:hypothetical protein
VEPREADTVPSEQDLTTLDAEVARLETILDAERQAARRRARVFAVFAVLLLAVVSGVVLGKWSDLSDEWTPENLEASLSREMERLGPVAMDELVEMGQHLVPVFMQQGADQFEGHADEIREAMSTEFDGLLADLRNDMRVRLEITRDRIRAGAEKMLLEQYPELADPEERTRLVTAFVAEADHALHTSIDDFVKRYAKEVDSFATVLGRFDAAGAEYSTPELQRKLIHLWLMAIDDRIMNS